MLDSATGRMHRVVVGRWRSPAPAPMRALMVAVQAIRMDDRLEVALVDNQHPVETLATAAPNPALGIGICHWRHQRSQDHPGALRLEDTIGLERELLVPIVNQRAEVDPFVLELPADLGCVQPESAEVPRLASRRWDAPSIQAAIVSQ